MKIMNNRKNTARPPARFNPCSFIASDLTRGNCAGVEFCNRRDEGEIFSGTFSGLAASHSRMAAKRHSNKKVSVEYST
jgi:hypothetical protein